MSISPEKRPVREGDVYPCCECCTRNAISGAACRDVHTSPCDSPECGQDWRDKVKPS